MDKAIYELYDELRFLYIALVGNVSDEILEDTKELILKYATLADDCYSRLEEEDEIL